MKTQSPIDKMNPRINQYKNSLIKHSRVISQTLHQVTSNHLQHCEQKTLITLAYRGLEIMQPSCVLGPGSDLPSEHRNIANTAR